VLFRVPKVSVIVPVYNPGSHIDDCIRSLLGQTMPPGDLELIFVDDGSTDATPARLDALAARHGHVRVEHIPNSGWPGRPRNVGLDMARGDYVYFVDNDDWLGAEAAERLHATAMLDDADIVIGKVVGHGKGVPRTLFRQNVHGVRFENPNLLTLLTPHKLFRRAFLTEHGIRFPEGRRRLEDHLFVVDAYFCAARISVLADYPCYHWTLRDRSVNASYRPYDAKGYYDNVREVLDLVERHTEPGPFREKVLLHWYRGKMLGRVGGGAFLTRDPGFRRELFEAVRGLALERYDESMHARLPFQLRIRSRLLRDGDLESLVALAELESRLRATVSLRRVGGDGTHLVVRLRARLGRDALVFRREGERVVWEPPEPLRGALAEEDLDVTEELRASRVQVFLHSLADESEYLVPVRTEVRLQPGAEPGRVQPVLRATARITPTTAAAGAPLPAGQWEVRAGATVAGYFGARTIQRPETKTPLVLTAIPPGRIVAAAQAPPPPSLPRRVGGAVRRTQARVAAAVRA
jgi:glycosyltransferase involved in cell wall biosynthesis